MRSRVWKIPSAFQATLGEARFAPITTAPEHWSVSKKHRGGGGGGGEGGSGGGGGVVGVEVGEWWWWG
jgi:hypothetical protein